MIIFGLQQLLQRRSPALAPWCKSIETPPSENHKIGGDGGAVPGLLFRREGFGTFFGRFAISSDRDLIESKEIEIWGVEDLLPNPVV